MFRDKAAIPIEEENDILKELEELEAATEVTTKTQESAQSNL